MIPVVIYSSIHNVHYAALEMSVTGWFQQPVDLDTLRALIDKYRYRSPASPLGKPSDDRG
jgi:hypothetical protein